MAFHISKTLFLHFLFCCSILICLSSGFPTEESVLPSTGGEEEEEFGRFQQWMKEHGKLYTNSEESELRYQKFRNNLKYITETNAKRSGYRLGLNKFADMSPEEFNKVYLRELPVPTTTDPNTTARSDYVRQNSCEPPASVDWRQNGVVTPVKDQQRCGSCWAFGTVGAIESMHAIRSGDLISLSEQELVDCNSMSNGCSGGSTKTAFQWVMENGGISEEADYPYEAQEGFCKATNMQNGGRVVKINSYGKVAESDAALLCATAQQPVTVSLDARGLHLYEDGIFDGGNCEEDSYFTNHAVLIVGYGSKNGEDYWIVKNSWGENWRSNGYFFIKRNTDSATGVCAINTKAYFPTM